MTVLTLRKAQEREIRSLRSDARHLTLVSKHLRDMANELSRRLKRNERAERARTNFFSKSAEVDSEMVLTPVLDTELFTDRVRAK